ncbi:MAG: 1-acylglycerol-3-phosphate O-acyltransferase [Bacteroidales bacterium]|nr:1-acylglycerol-3-phosphate O-acyltransferase [Bacteroidales bacterium]MBN2821205.1 1-acylglycerol-3-phosphate O-acyltransferase [Bacteroidales bacterium]
MSRTFLRIIYFPYKWLLLLPVMVINTIIFGLIAVVVSSFVNQRVGSYYGGVVWSRFNAMITPMFVSVKGKENIKEGVSYIVVPNHQSLYDIFLIYGWLGLDIKWIMKKELEKIPGLGFGSKKVGHIFIDRSNQIAAMRSLEEAKKKLVDGTCVVIFPEGTRSAAGKLRPFKRGAFKMAIDLGLPILPVTINGTKNILPGKAAVDILPGKATLTIHKPVELAGYSAESMPQLMLNVRDIIESALAK